MAAIEVRHVYKLFGPETGHARVLDLLKTAKHGRGEKIYLVRFHYVAPRGPKGSGKPSGKKSARAEQRR